MPNPKYYLDKAGLRSLIENILAPSTYVAEVTAVPNAEDTFTATYYRGTEQHTCTYDKFYENRTNAVVLVEIEQGLYQYCKFDSEWEAGVTIQSLPSDFEDSDGCMFRSHGNNIAGSGRVTAYLSLQDDEGTITPVWKIRFTPEGHRLVKLTQPDPNDPEFNETYPGFEENELAPQYFIDGYPVTEEEFCIEQEPQDVSVWFVPMHAVGITPPKTYYQFSQESSTGGGTLLPTITTTFDYSNAAIVREGNIINVQCQVVTTKATGEKTIRWFFDEAEHTPQALHISVLDDIENARFADLVVWDNTAKCKQCIHKEDLDSFVSNGTFALPSNYSLIGIIAIPSNLNIYGNDDAMMIGLTYCSKDEPESGTYDGAGGYMWCSHLDEMLTEYPEAAQFVDNSTYTLSIGTAQGGEFTKFDDRAPLTSFNAVSDSRIVSTLIDAANAGGGDVSIDFKGFVLPAPTQQTAYDNPDRVILYKLPTFEDPRNVFNKFNGKELTEYLWGLIPDEHKGLRDDWTQDDLITSFDAYGSQASSAIEVPLFWPAYFCHWYRTAGTAPGDWYWGAPGEMLYVMANSRMLYETYRVVNPTQANAFWNAIIYNIPSIGIAPETKYILTNTFPSYTIYETFDGTSVVNCTISNGDGGFIIPCCRV